MSTVDKVPTLNPFGRTPAASSAFLTYEPYYGLREKPFSLSTDPRFLYKSAGHANTFEDLLLAIRRREGLIVLTGDIGTGKTTLCKAVLERLDRKTFTTFVPDPFVTREDLLKMMLLDFGVMSVDDLKSGRMTGTSHPDLSYPLYDFLKSLVPLQAFAVLIIDEAQNLSPKQMKTLITRAGPGTKIVCLGNLAQIDTPYLTEGSSGLTYAVDRFKGWPHGGHIMLARGERSRLADFASEVL